MLRLVVLSTALHFDLRLRELTIVLTSSRLQEKLNTNIVRSRKLRFHQVMSSETKVS